MTTVEDAVQHVQPALIEFLKWVATADRSYEETMDAWRTSCPRFSLWEDASIAGYVVLIRGDERGDVVRLAELGRQLLEPSWEARR
jgi:hypothetical protein